MKHKEKQVKLLQRIEDCKAVVALLKDWGEVRGYVPDFGGIYGTINIENYFEK